MATRVTITKALEAKLRKAAEETPEGYTSAVNEIVKLLDEAQGKRAAGSKVAESKTGLGYQELVALLRSYLGHSLLTPPKPNVSFIIKIVNKAKEQGLAYDNVEQILTGLRRANPRGPYRLADIIYNLDRYYAIGGAGPTDGSREGLFSALGDAPDKGAEDEDTEAKLELGFGSRVYTGRPGPSSDDGGGED